MNKIGAIHTLKCNCILNQHLELVNPPFFHFFAFSVITDDVVESKITQCPNCGILHKIKELGVSQILFGKEESKSIITLSELKMTLPINLVQLLEKYDLDLSRWEMASFILENEKWGDFIILTSEIMNDIKYGKYIRILGKDIYKIENFEMEV